MTASNPCKNEGTPARLRFMALTTQSGFGSARHTNWTVRLTMPESWGSSRTRRAARRQFAASGEGPIEWWLPHFATPGRPRARENDAPNYIHRSTNIYQTLQRVEG
jgi:hypothetical protein